MTATATYNFKVKGRDMNARVMKCRSCDAPRAHRRTASTIWTCGKCGAPRTE